MIDDKEKFIGVKFGPWPFPDFRAQARQQKERKPAKKPANARNQKEPSDDRK